MSPRTAPLETADEAVLPPAPDALAPGATVASSDSSEALAGITFERSESAPCQSKRLAAIWRTVAARCWARSRHARF